MQYKRVVMADQRWLVVAVAMVAVMTMAWGAARAEASVAGASVTIANDNGTNALFASGDMRPGVSESACLTVSVANALSGDRVRITALDVSGALASGLTLTVDIGTGGGGGSCTGFTGAQVYSGTLTDLAATATTDGAETSWDPSQNAVRSFRITVAVADDQSLQGQSAAGRFAWLFVPGTGTTPQSPPPSTPSTTSPTTSTNPTTSTTTSDPTSSPTSAPTSAPTSTPTGAPTRGPVAGPIGGPTGVPTDAPTSGPTTAPTEEPTDVATGAPTGAPSESTTGELTSSSTDTAPSTAPTTARASTGPRGRTGSTEELDGGGGAPGDEASPPGADTAPEVDVEVVSPLDVVLSRTVVALGSDPQYPIAALLVVLVFLMVQHGLDRGDPKLAVASATQKDNELAFHDPFAPSRLRASGKGPGALS